MKTSHAGAIAAATLVLGVLVAPQPVGAATAPTKVSVGAKSSSYATPYVFRTSKGTTLVSWYVDPSGPAQRFQLVRQRGSGKFTPVDVAEQVSGNPMKIWSAPQFYQTGKKIRMVTQAEVPALGQEHQGTYVWTSTNDGKSWSAPKLVYKYFGSNEISPDSTGGFWAVSELTSVYAIHVPSSLAFQANKTSLSNRITSRLWIRLTTAGPKRTLLTAFYGSDASFLHVGTAFGQQYDVKVFGKSAAQADLAGDTKRAMLVAIHPRGYKSSAPNSVYARSIAVNASGKVTLGKEVRLSGKAEDVNGLDVSVAAIAGHPGQFGVTWLSKSEQVRYRHTTATGWAKATTRYSYGASSGYSYLARPTSTAKWIVAAAYRNQKGGQPPAIIAVHTK